MNTLKILEVAPRLTRVVHAPTLELVEKVEQWCGRVTEDGLQPTSHANSLCRRRSLARTRARGGVAADQIRPRATLSEIDSRRLSESATVIILAPDETRTIQLLASVRQFRGQDPGTAMLLCLREGSRTQHQLASFARSGIDDFVIVDAADALDRLRRDVAQRLKNALPVSLVRGVTPNVEHSARRYLTWCYRNVYRALHVADVEDRFHESPKTVKRYLDAAGLPRLHVIVALARLLYVGYRLDTTQASIEWISEALSFKSVQALDNFVKRVTNLTPSELQERGAVEHMKMVIDANLHR